MTNTIRLTWLAPLTHIERHPDIDVVYMGVIWFGKTEPGGKPTTTRQWNAFSPNAGGQREGDLSRFDDTLLPALLKSVPMAFQRPVVRRAALERIGGYRADCLLWDCDWAIRATLEGRAALIHSGLYRQRAEGQGYSSRQDRTLEHMQSGIEIAERLLHLSQQGTYRQHRAIFRCTARDAWFNLAWHHYLFARTAPRMLEASAGERTHTTPCRPDKIWMRLLV